MSARPLSHHSCFSLGRLRFSIATKRALSREFFNGIGQERPFKFSGTANFDPLLWNAHCKGNVMGSLGMDDPCRPSRGNTEDDVSWRFQMFADHSAGARHGPGAQTTTPRPSAIPS